MEIILVVVGNRDYDNYEFFCKTMDRYIAHFGYEIRKVYSGDAPGIDQMTEDWAISRGYKFEAIPAVWQLPDGSTDRGAGMKRNEILIAKGTHVVAFWDGKSTGTKHSSGLAKELNKTRMIVPIVATKKRYYCARWKAIYAERNKAA